MYTDDLILTDVLPHLIADFLFLAAAQNLILVTRVLGLLFDPVGIQIENPCQIL